MKSYTLICDENCDHKVKVFIHNSHAKYLRAVKEKKNSDPGSVACCVLFDYPNDDRVIAELHFSKKSFSVGIVAHECFHAAFFRGLLMGKVVGTDDWEEFVADGLQKLTEAILDEGKN